ncbi:hypothetical protein [Nonomuraea sp. NPDC046570]|uniref:hypothetical protein n=1 Tax=Nonomuraea sp. NPDC046570 TaxID=3155255 RepID=UPI0033FED86F
MRRWFKILIATLVPLTAGGVTWWAAAGQGLDGDEIGLAVALVTGVFGTPLGI